MEKGMNQDNHIGQRPFNVIPDSIADGVFTVDGDWLITSLNRAAEQITGVLCEEASGQRCSEAFHANICESACALHETMETGQPIINKPVYIVATDGRRISISIGTALLTNERAKVIGGAETFRDLSLVEELRKDLEGRYSCEDVISRSREMQHIFDLLPNAAQSESTALIEGPSGSGRQLLARGPQPQPSTEEALGRREQRGVARHTS